MARGHVYRRRLTSGAFSGWHAVIDTTPGADGRRRQITRTFSTRSAAHAWLAEQAAQRIQAVGPTLAEYLESWLGRQHHLRPSTRLSYSGHIRRHLSPTMGTIRLTELTRADVQDAYVDLRDQGMSPALVRRVHSTLSAALTSAVRDGDIVTNPTVGVRLPSPAPFTATVWTAAQAATFLAVTAEDEWAVLWRMALLTGLRRGELLGLRWSDIDFDAGTLTVRHTLTAVAGQVVSGPPKSRRGIRTVVLDVRTVEMLTDHLDWCQVEQLACGVDTGTDLVFAFRGRSVHPSWVSRRFRTLVVDAGLPTIRFHDLRHTSATLGLAHGESVKEVSARLGHSSLAITGDLYVQVPDEVARRSAHRLAATLEHHDPGAA